jgi:hypothetical protein
MTMTTTNAGKRSANIRNGTSKSPSDTDADVDHIVIVTMIRPVEKGAEEKAKDAGKQDDPATGKKSRNRPKRPLLECH